MSATSGGSVATLLMTVPLAAIPLMAVFGVPQFTSVSASSEPSPEDIRRHPPSVLAAGAGQPSEANGSQSGSEGNGFVFPAVPQTSPSTGGAPRPLTRPSIVQALPSGPTPGAPLQPAAVSSPPRPTALATSAADYADPDPGPAHATRPRRPRAVTMQTPPTQEHFDGLSWQQAAQQLQQWGIDDFRLERGHKSGSFLFVCQIAPRGDPRIVRRFEAEHTEPLLAVQEVFARIEEWRQSTQATAPKTR